jgi:addiction module HigA family antidote
MPMMNPPHPGEIVREECLRPLGLTVTEAAGVLGVTRQALNNLINEHSGISPEMAIRLEKAFGSSADMWMRLQATFELAQARKGEGAIAVERYRSGLRAGKSGAKAVR